MMGRTREADDLSNGRGPIAIIGDSQTNTTELSANLRSEGFSTLVWPLTRGDNGGSSAIRPVGVIIDWAPPGGTGIEVCRQLRRGDPLLPILFVGGPEAEASINRGLDAGADDFLLRPLRPGELGARLGAGLRGLTLVSVHPWRYSANTCSFKAHSPHEPGVNRTWI